MPSQPAWVQPRNVALLIGAYLLVHFAVRLWMGPTLGLDDAEQALFAQHWLLNYRFRAPPLFTWALVGANEVVSPGVLIISIIRYGLLAMLAAFVYLTARRLIRDQRLAALATFSFTAIYVFGYYSHHDLTHTTVLSTFLAASWYVFVRLPHVGGIADKLTAGLDALRDPRWGVFAIVIGYGIWLMLGWTAILAASAAGIGPSEAAWVTAVTGFGVPWDDAVVSALTLHAVVLANAILLGGIASIGAIRRHGADVQHPQTRVN